MAKDATPVTVAHQISFIDDQELTRIDFLCTLQEGRAMSDRLRPILESSLGDFQVYRPDTVNVSGAEETLRQVCGNTSMDEDELAGMEEAFKTARQIDAGCVSGEAGTATLEFVWNNGGGDDNAFSQSFRVAEAQRHLVDVLARQIASGPLSEWVYDLEITNPSQIDYLPDTASALRELLEILDPDRCDEITNKVAAAFPNHGIEPVEVIDVPAAAP